MNNWPNQPDCAAFYGDPRLSDFEGKHLVVMPVPWLMVTAWDGKPVKGIRVNRKCADSLARILAVIWSAAGKSQDIINEWGLNKYGGGYAFRQMRNGKSLSMHSYGCAVDFDPSFNAMGDPDPHLADCQIVIAAFEAEGWAWGGRWSNPDGMHFQAARVG
jgi:hypothetical protein